MKEKFRVLITGANGQLGHELTRDAPQWAEVLGRGSQELDITSVADISAAILDFKPSLIINAAAYTAVDKAETEVERAYAVNKDGPANLARAAAKAQIPIFHVSTDYVFSGDANKPYAEDDLTSPTGVYGASKLAGEQALKEECPESLVLRISWVFGAHGNNFVKTMLRLAVDRTELSVVNDQFGCPTSAESAALALWQLAQHYKEQGSLQWGTYHYTGDPACTWYEFAQEVFNQAIDYGLLVDRPKVLPISTLEFPTPARRPAWSVLSGQKLSSQYAIGASDWKKDLTKVLRSIKTN